MTRTFSRAERLSGKQNFELLVSKGNSFFVHPFRIIWMKSDKEQDAPVKIAFGVPKRNFKQAVKRNRIKRLMREAYRQQKTDFYSSLALKSVKITVLIVYAHRDMPEYEDLRGKIILSLQRLINAIDGAGKDS